jgi:hypothetical protein
MRQLPGADPIEPVTVTGGTVSTPQTYWIKITWAFPAGAPTPTNFDVVAYVGTDPTNTANYLFPPVKVEASDREYITSITPSASLGTVSAAVRSNYA